MATRILEGFCRISTPPPRQDLMAAMKGRETRPTNGQDHERLSPCVCRTLRMVSRAVTQLYDNLLRPEDSHHKRGSRRRSHRGGYRRDGRRVGGEWRPAASAGGAPGLLVEERDAEQDHPQDQEGEDAVRGPHGGEIHEEHLEHREAEERQRGIADGRARADEAPAERGRE